jgi:glycosyltransferase involved in cell wall biosynthesis
MGSLVLTRPASRISINRIVADTIGPWLDHRGLHRVINLGHDAAYFAKERTGGLGSPVRVAYTTWKSDVGIRVQASLDGEPGFEFRSIRETATWPQLRELYHWADVFLCAPSPEEGMYLPGLEAMAAGALVVTPDVGGNLAYCRPDENCLLVGYDAVDDYVAVLRRLVTAPVSDLEAMRSAGYAIVPSFDLAAERAGFAAFLDELLDRVEHRETRDEKKRREAT